MTNFVDRIRRTSRAGRSAQRAFRPLVVFAGWLLVGLSGPALAEQRQTNLPETLHQIYFAGTPESVDDLRLMDAYQQELVKQVTRVTVGLQIGATQGSGVLISEDGYVLTAAHVASRVGLDVRVIMPDGETHRAKTLGMNKGKDAGLLKLAPVVQDGKSVKWPFAAMGDSRQLRPGSWCMALGHPGGYQIDRQPVARFGRVLTISNSVIETDCKLVGGDSGGPLFDMEGRVVGVHSRIGSKLTKNLHVPVNAYRTDWERLARGDSWGSLLSVIGRPIMGVRGEKETDDARIAFVVPASPAERAGIKPGDLITQFGGNKVTSFDRLKELVNQRHPGDEVEVELLRGKSRLKLSMILGAYGGS